MLSPILPHNLISCIVCCQGMTEWAVLIGHFQFVYIAIMYDNDTMRNAIDGVISKFYWS